MYIRYVPIEGRESFEFEIPGYRVEDQSANSHNLNQPNGEPSDVLYDTRYGRHYFGTHQVARLDVDDLYTLKIPNPNTVIRRAKDGAPLNKEDEYTFEVIHVPTPCMYPHCEIRPRKNGLPGSVSNGIKTTLRAQIARLADKHRGEMQTLKLSSTSSEAESPRSAITPFQSGG